MHLVTKSFFDEFCDQFNLPKGETKSFESFCNFCVFNDYSEDNVDPNDLVYDGADPGIDGAMLFVDGRAIYTTDELDDFLKAGKKEYEFTFVFTQVKSSTTWVKKEIDTFGAALIDFLSDDPAQPLSDFLREFKKLFKRVYENIGRIKGGLPDFRGYFMTASEATTAVEILAAATIAQNQLEKSGYFKSCRITLSPREDIHALWQACGGDAEATLKVIAYAPFPAAPNVKSAYVATVSAFDFLNSVLKAPDGSKRKKLFEQNVRDFLGDDEEVNSEIASTLSTSDRKQRFGLMNNGITIVADRVQPAGQSIFIRKFQIVNGCQTSNVLLANQDLVDESVSIMVKFIESEDAATIDDIVRATNRQSKVEDEQFASALNSLRKIEEYFLARGGAQANRLVFERRKGQHSGEGIPQPRIVDIRELAKSVSATRMFRPDLSSRYVGRLTGEMREDVFDTAKGEEIFYVSCFANYRLRILISNKKFDQRYSKLKWHILCACWKACVDLHKSFGCNSPESAFEKMFAANDGVWFERLQKIVSICLPDPQVSRDVLKGQAFTATILKKLAEGKESIPKL